MFRILFLMVALLCLPLTALAAAEWTLCGGTPTAGQDVPMTVTKDVLICYEFDDATDSSKFSVGSDTTALVCFDPDITTDGAATGQVDIRKCHRGTKPSASPANECFAITASKLTGAVVGPGVQDACIRVAAGSYYIDVTTSPATAAVVSIQGEGS